MKKTIILAGLMLCTLSAASAAPKTQQKKGLHADPGALSPMEARIERASGDKKATSIRIDNAKRASKKLQDDVEDSQLAPNGHRVRYKRVKKCGCSGAQGGATPACPAVSSGVDASAQQPASCRIRKRCSKKP